MKPEDYIDENDVPTEEDFMPEEVDEEKRLRKDIKKQCFFNMLCFICITGSMVMNSFTWHGSIYMIVFAVICALTSLFLVFVYYRISRAPTVQEMSYWHSKSTGSSPFFKGLFALLGLVAALGVASSMWDAYPWYLTTFVILLIVAIVFGVFWLMANYKEDSLGDDIESLKELEEEKKQKAAK